MEIMKLPYLLKVKSGHPYIRDFVMFADASLDNGDSFKSMNHFATSISRKAQSLFKMAAANPRIDLLRLQKEIHEIGRVYLLQFAVMSKHKDKNEMQNDLSGKQ